MTYNIFWEHQRCWVSYTDTVTFDEFMCAVQGVHRHDNFRNFDQIIHDLSAAQAIVFDHVCPLTLMSHELGARCTNSRILSAVITSHPAVCDLITRVNVQAKLGIGLFGTVHEARAWLARQQ